MFCSYGVFVTFYNCFINLPPPPTYPAICLQTPSQTPLNRGRRALETLGKANEKLRKKIEFLGFSCFIIGFSTLIEDVRHFSLVFFVQVFLPNTPQIPLQTPPKHSQNAQKSIKVVRGFNLLLSLALLGGGRNRPGGSQISKILFFFVRLSYTRIYIHFTSIYVMLQYCMEQVPDC